MEINRHNYKEVLMLMLDDEVGPEEKLQAEAYMLLHEEAAEEWEALKKTKLRPANEVVFPRMALLLKEEETETSVLAKIGETNIKSLQNGSNVFGKKLMYWSAAASIAALVMLFALLKFNGNETNSVALINETEKTSAENKIHIRGTEKMLVEPGEIKTQNFEKTLPINSKYSEEKIKTKAFLEGGIYVKTSKENIGLAKTENETQAGKNEMMAFVQLPVGEVENYEKSKAKLVRKVNRRMNADLLTWEKQAAVNEEANPPLLASLVNFFSDNLHIEKKTINEDDFYAVTLETQNVHISRTFKSNF